MGLDEWLFSGDTDIISRAGKASRYFVAWKQQNTKFLVFWRISCLIYFTVTEVNYWFVRREEWTPPLLFMTNQGHYFYRLFNLLTLAAYTCHALIGEPIPADSGSPWLAPLEVALYPLQPTDISPVLDRGPVLDHVGPLRY